MRTPLPPPAEPVVSGRIAEFLSGDRQFRLADAEGQPYSHSWRNAPSGGSGRLDTNPVTPLKSHHHHPLSDIAPCSSSNSVICIVRWPCPVWSSHSTLNLAASAVISHSSASPVGLRQHLLNFDQFGDGFVVQRLSFTQGR